MALLKQIYLTALSFLAISLTICEQVRAASALPQLNLEGYQQKSGAILHWHQDPTQAIASNTLVDPYMAMRALNTAQDEGLDISKVGLPWVKWLLQKQKQDGRFGRYCYTKSDASGIDHYKTCVPDVSNNHDPHAGDADADDVDMALWMELLTLFAQDPTMPHNWQQSFDKAFTYLTTKLYDSKKGIYYVFDPKQRPDYINALFMDNVEIANAFFAIAKLKKQQGDTAGQTQFERLANNLVVSMQKEFGSNNKNYSYEISANQTANHTVNFYPGSVSQIYPLAFFIHINDPASKIPVEMNILDANQYITDWYTTQFITTDSNNNPSGRISAEEEIVIIADPTNYYDDCWLLVALAAIHGGNATIATTWLSVIKPYHDGTQELPYKNFPYWNVFDEAIYQVLSQQV